MNIVRELRERAGMQQKELALLVGVSRPTVSEWEHNKKNPSGDRLRKLAEIFKVDVGTVLGYGPSVIPISRGAVPVVGSIACGTPITAEQNIEGYADLPSGLSADFALRCVGESMAPTFRDGDLVLIRQQADVDDGRVAAVLIENEATLKRIHHLPDGVILNPDNQSAFSPLVFRKGETENIRILGVAIGFVRLLE